MPPEANAAAAGNEIEVLIVGAGPTGLVLALWLIRLGVRVRIVDQAAEPGTTSRAIGVAPRTLELYRQMGLAEALVEAGHKVPAVNLWTGGTHAARMPLSDMGSGLTPFPYMLIYPQDEHERLLIDRLKKSGVVVERPTTLVSFEQHTDHVLATLRDAAGAASTCRCRYLAGCDGASSTVRNALDTGFPGGTYEHLFYVADAEAAGPAADGEIHVDLETADFLAVFPLKGSGRVRLIGTVAEPPAGAPPPTFDDVGRRVIDDLQLKILEVNWFSTYRVHHRVTNHFRRGRVFLLGDAAHVHSPVGAQGMNTGIGDAINLAWKLAAVLHSGADDTLLETYEQERIGFAHRLVSTTDRIFTFVSKPGGIARIVRTRIAPVVLPLFLRRRFARRYLFRTVSQIGIRYRRSSLSAGEAGGIHGGDRLPWTPLAPATSDDGRRCDNFTPLDGRAWRVQVYGDPQPELDRACERNELALDRFEWEPEMSRNGLIRDALYLVRPDGYLALVDPRGSSEAVRSYFGERRLPTTAALR